LERHFQDIAIIVRSHPETASMSKVAAVPYQPGTPVRAAVIGTITRQKGSEILQACAGDASRNQRPLEFVVLGRTDRDAALARTGRVKLTGPYLEAEALDRVKIAECHLAFLPSVVPETYMYALSIALRGGLFPVCYDIGAQAERLRSQGEGLIIPLDAEPAAINQALIDAANALAAQPQSSWRGPEQTSENLLESYYGFTDDERARFDLITDAATSGTALNSHARRESHARLH
jgi:hypothetical protein